MQTAPQESANKWLESINSILTLKYSLLPFAFIIIFSELEELIQTFNMTIYLQHPNKCAIAR